MKHEIQSFIESVHQACRVDKTLSFPEAIMRLAGAGVESYHTDYRRQETTYYLVSGESHIVTDHTQHGAIAGPWDAEAVVAAIRFAQSNSPEYSYARFVALTCAAGCVGYLVWIAGRQAQYFGRRGEIHVEHFPGSK